LELVIPTIEEVGSGQEGHSESTPGAAVTVTDIVPHSTQPKPSEDVT